MANVDNFVTIDTVYLYALVGIFCCLAYVQGDGVSNRYTIAPTNYLVSQQLVSGVSAAPPGGTIPNTNEPCETTESVPDAIVLSADEHDWEMRLTAADAAGHTFLLRGGLYQATDKLWLRAGMPQRPTLIKPYNCEYVTLYTSIRPSSYTVIAGLHIEAKGIEDTKWAIRFDGEDRGAIANIILRNNLVLGGTIDAIRLSSDVRNVLIQGNHIDGGEEGHDIFITGVQNGVQPDQITITQNLFTKNYFAAASEDMLQVRDVGAVIFTSNICTNGPNMEQCVDIKNTSTPMVISHNLFDGEHLHTVGPGKDSAGGCMVIHENDGHPEQHRIEHNLFRYCKGTVIRFAAGTGDVSSSARVSYNLFLQRDQANSLIPIEIASNTEFFHNTMIRGTLKLGNSDQSRLPQDLLFRDNIFYQSVIEDHTRTDQPAYRCINNLMYAPPDGGFTAIPCAQTIHADPLFVDSAAQNFYLRPNSPALGVGTDGGDLGALPVLYPLTHFSYSLYLPQIFQ